MRTADTSYASLLTVVNDRKRPHDEAKKTFSNYVQQVVAHKVRQSIGKAVADGVRARLFSVNIEEEAIEQTVEEKIEDAVKKSANRVTYALSHINPSRKLEENYTTQEEPCSAGKLLPARVPIGSRDKETPPESIMDWNSFLMMRWNDFKESLQQGEALPKNQEKPYDVYLYTITPEEKILLAKECDNIKHIDLDGGRPSALAGEMHFKKGTSILKKITQQSGHYRHSEKSFLEGCRLLYRQGILRENTKIEAILPENQKVPKKYDSIYNALDNLYEG